VVASHGKAVGSFPATINIRTDDFHQPGFSCDLRRRGIPDTPGETCGAISGDPSRNLGAYRGNTVDRKFQSKGSAAVTVPDARDQMSRLDSQDNSVADIIDRHWSSRVPFDSAPVFP
jgi:hypothetical protein